MFIPHTCICYRCLITYAKLYLRFACRLLSVFERLRHSSHYKPHKNVFASMGHTGATHRNSKRRFCFPKENFTSRNRVYGPSSIFGDIRRYGHLLQSFEQLYKHIHRSTDEIQKNSKNTHKIGRWEKVEGVISGIIMSSSQGTY